VFYRVKYRLIFRLISAYWAIFTKYEVRSIRTVDTAVYSSSTRSRFMKSIIYHLNISKNANVGSCEYVVVHRICDVVDGSVCHLGQDFPNRCV
jgi:hypothetical protein